MCLITFAYKVHPDYKLILAANRDEFYERPTRKAQFWKDEDYPDILAGKDLKAGGTWMGIKTSGIWGALTNYRDPSIELVNPPSRGELVLDFLKSDKLPVKHLKKIKSESSKYNGFNLLLGDSKSLYHFSNINNTITDIQPGVHGISNALLNTSWPKLNRAKNQLSEVVQKKNFELNTLFDLLKNENKPPKKQLPDTGIPLEWEKAVSSIFIKTQSYGTRCSTVLLIDNNDMATFTERTYDPITSKILQENTFKLVFS